MQKDERISTSLSKEMAEKLKQEAKEKGLTLSSLMRMILIEYLRKDKK